jgi:hypothetical protein
MERAVKSDDVRNGIALMIEEYFDKIDISSEKMDQIVQMAADIYGKIKESGNAPDGEQLGLTLFLVANQAKGKNKPDPHEFTGYA